MIYFNEIERYPAQWLRNLYPEAQVDERSIVDVGADDVAGHGRVHFFAGVGGWEQALRLAGWPADRPVWTGSCPCQPFSQAGKRTGTADARHLWPEFWRLIRECRPPTIFGEQVASKAGLEWFAGVRDDLEVLGYAVGAADLCAASVGAPHIRQRLYWVADARRGSDERGGRSGEACGEVSPVEAEARQRQWGGDDPWCSGSRLDNSERERGRGEQEHRGEQSTHRVLARGSGQGGWWSGAEWIDCLDGKTRRAEPGVRLLADGVSARVGRLRAYGNAIVPPLAAEFIRAFLDAEE